jgi:hypothetical protein
MPTDHATDRRIEVEVLDVYEEIANALYRPT